MTTRIGESRASVAVATARRTTLRPLRSMSILLRPMRLPRPAASTMPAIRSRCMDASRARPQVARLAVGVNGQHFSHDADGHLLGTVRAQVEAHRREERVLVEREIAHHLLLAVARPEQPEI